jgi:hypothetical protein
MGSSDVQRTTEKIIAMVLLGGKGIRRKLRVKLWGKTYLGSDRGRNRKSKKKRKLNNYLSQGFARCVKVRLVSYVVTLKNN